MTQQFFLTATLAAAVLATAAPAFAQLRPPTAVNMPNRPYRGIFGGGQNQGGGDRLIIRGWLAGGYDDVMRRELTAGSVPPVARRNGPFGSGAMTMGYSITRSAVSFNAHGGAAARAYTGMSGKPIVTYSVTAQSGFTITKTTQLSLNVQSGSYLQNFAAFGPLAGGGGSPLSSPSDQLMDPTALAGGQTYQSSRVDMMLGQKITTKASLNFGYQYYMNNAWVGGPGGYDGQSLSAGASYEIAKGLAVRAGYSAIGSGFRTGSPTQFRGRGIDAGVDFNKSLSVTRKSSLGFGTGATGYADSSNTIRYVWTGHVNYSYEMGRSWSLGAGYNRSADFFTTFGQPVLLDWANVGVSGMFGRRYQLSGDIGASKGDVLITVGNSGYKAALGSTSLRTALSRELGVSVTYSYYHYFVDNGVPLPPGMLSRMEQQSVRVSLEVWAPLMSRARRTNASR